MAPNPGSMFGNVLTFCFADTIIPGMALRDGKLWASFSVMVRITNANIAVFFLHCTSFTNECWLALLLLLLLLLLLWLLLLFLPHSCRVGSCSPRVMCR